MFPRKMKWLLMMTLLSISSVGAMDTGELVGRLPGIRTKAFADTATLRAGNTTEMIDAAAAVRDRLLPLVVTLESKLEKKSETEIRALIERDLEAVSRDARIRGNSEGWGGTGVAVDSAWAVVEHLEARASWCVWQLMEDVEGFNFAAWHARWVSEGGSTEAGSPAVPSGPKPGSEDGSR